MKYRHKFSSHVQAWQWIDIGDLGQQGGKERAIKYWCDTLTDGHSHSEHYRGIDYELKRSPPKAIINKQLERIDRDISELKMRAIGLERLLRNGR